MLNTFDFKNFIYILVAITLLTLFLVLFFIGIASSKKKNVKKVVETKESKNQMEELLNVMQQDLETKKANPVSSFEEEQEEKAIISYQQLLEAKKQKEENNSIEAVIPASPKTEPINIPVETKIEAISEPIDSLPVEHYEVKPEILDFPSEISKPQSSFTTSEVISPIFGRTNLDDIKSRSEEEIKNDQYLYRKSQSEILNIPEYNNEYKSENLEVLNEKPKVTQNIEVLSFDNYKENDDSLEKTLNIPVLTEEVKHDEDFLKALKDLRSNL